jgi:hypothetical protein
MISIAFLFTCHSVISQYPPFFKLTALGAEQIELGKIKCVFISAPAVNFIAATTSCHAYIPGF